MVSLAHSDPGSESSLPELQGRVATGSSCKRRRKDRVYLPPGWRAPFKRESIAYVEVMAQEYADFSPCAGDPENWVHRRLIVELAEKNRLPAIYPYREYVETGGLMAYSFDQAELWIRAAGASARRS